jgi:hypothetical protein
MKEKNAERFPWGHVRHLSHFDIHHMIKEETNRSNNILGNIFRPQIKQLGSYVISLLFLYKTIRYLHEIYN